MLEAIEENDMEKLQCAMKRGNVNSAPGIWWLEMLVVESPDRQTPLQAACKEGNFEMVKFLLENGADPYYRPINASVYALCYAVKHRTPQNLEIVKFLLETDANSNISRKALTTSAATRATEYLFWDEPREMDNKMEILQELIAAGGAPVDSCVRDACYWGNDEIIKYLVEECGCDISGYLHILLYCRDFEKYSAEMFEFMLQHGANPYEKSEDGKCAMDYLREKSPEWADKLAELAKKYGYEE